MSEIEREEDESVRERGEDESVRERSQEIESRNMTLPRYVVIKSISNDKFLHFIHIPGIQNFHGFLEFTGEDVLSPYSKFEVERAKSGNERVHIKSSYSNKYWVRDSSISTNIVAKANEPEEDISKWSCTLFEPVYVDITKMEVRFRHVQSGGHAWLFSTRPWMVISQGTDQLNNPARDIFAITDFESLLILPEHVAFKGDNGLYLRSQRLWTRPHLQFAISDIGDPTVGHQVFPNPDGSIRIKSNTFDRFWRRDSPYNWIWADTDETSINDPHTRFWPIKVTGGGNNNIIALHNMGNNKLCKRLTAQLRSDCLSADVSTFSTEARLEVEELVLSREIFNVTYHLMDAKIYDEHVITLVNREVTNNFVEPTNMSVGFSYEDKRSRTWSSTISLTLGRQISMSAGIPLIGAQGEVTISAEFRGEYQWGRTEETTLTVHTTESVVVPPMTSVTVRLIATEGSCDVPFSYSQRDLLVNGRYVTYFKNDGMYTGINAFNIRSMIA